MTMRPAMLLLLIVFAAAALAITFSQRRLRRAQQDLAAAQMAVVQTARDARTITQLRTQSQIIETRQRPAQDVIAQVNAVLAEVGIPTTHLQSLTPEGDAAVVAPNLANGARGPGLRQQSLRLTLQGLAPPQIGSFLMRWQEVQRVWSAARLELVHNNARESTTANLYDATIVMTAMYLAESAPPSGENR